MKGRRREKGWFIYVSSPSIPGGGRGGRVEWECKRSKPQEAVLLLPPLFPLIFFVERERPRTKNCDKISRLVIQLDVQPTRSRDPFINLSNNHPVKKTTLALGHIAELLHGVIYRVFIKYCFFTRTF